MEKHCAKCELNLSTQFFYKNKARSDGLQTYCKLCMAKVNATSFQLHKKRRLKQSARYQKTEKSKKYRREWAYNKYHSNEDHRKKCIQDVTNRERDLLKNDIQFRLKKVLRGRVRQALKSKNKCNYRIMMLIGCSIHFFKQYIEVQFIPGMTWSNYGKLWDIDHIIPIAYDNCKNELDMISRFNWSNCQPMWHNENVSKGNRYISFNDNIPLTVEEYIKCNAGRLYIICGRLTLRYLLSSRHQLNRPNIVFDPFSS